ncbi:MAG: hypothetical protein FJZ89_00390 [Chloroflexi bacterium]|nr:hypothetical protein [Chloroflexota bacterium]
MDALLILCVLASLALTPPAPPVAERAFAASTPSVLIEPWWPGLELRPLPEAAAPAPTIRDPQAATLLAAGPPATVTVTANPTSRHADGASTATTTGEPYTITLAAVPAVIRADGISTATITATVRDVGGNPLPDVVVGVTATRGTTGLSFVEGEGTGVTKSPGAWTEVINPQASGGKYVQSNGAFYPTASASWTFTASTISLLYAKNSLGGIAAVQVDSSPTMLIDMYSAVATFDEYIVPWLSAGPHTITVTQTSPPTNNPNSGGYLIYVDAFRAGGRTNANGQVVTWLRSSNVTSTSTVRATVLGSGPLFYTETNVIFAWPPAITFTAAITPVVLSCGITDTITATVSNGGYPIAGTVVTFTVSPGTLGTVAPPTATTNASGQAVTVFTANKVGTGVITATATDTSNTLSITVNPGLPITPTLSVSPGQLVATGNTTATVTLTATDTCGNAITDGTLVGFQTSLGSIAPEYYLAPYNDARIAKSGSWSSTADCGGYYYTIDPSAVATYAFTGTAVSLIYRQHPANGVANVWIDGWQIKTIDQSGTDKCDQKVSIATNLILGTHVLTMTWASGGFVVFQGFESGGATLGGVATGVLTSTRLADADPVTETATITGTVYGSIVTGTTSVIFGKPVVSIPDLSAGKTTLVADGADTTTLTATVRDAFGGFSPNGTMVGFTVTTGMGSFPYTYVESSDSTVTKTGDFLTPRPNPQASGGDLRYSDVTGEYVRWTFTGTAVSLIHNTQDNGGEADVTVDGLYTKTVDMYSPAQTWQVETVISNTLSPGAHTITVTVKGTHHFTSSGYYVFVDAFRSGTTTSGGKATATLTAGANLGPATIMATAVGSVVTKTTTVNFIPGPPLTVTLGQDAYTVTCNTTSTVTATVLAYGNNVVTDGTPVTFTTNVARASFSPNPASTVNGVVTTTVSGTTSSSGLFTATATASVWDTASLTVNPGPPATLVVTAHPARILANDISTALITATVRDACGNLVAENTPVTFTTSLGTIVEAQPRSTSGGVVTSTLRSGLAPGPATVTVVAGQVQTTTIVYFTGAPWTITVTAVPPSIPVGGDTLVVTATVQDVFGNPISDGTLVYFQTSLGSIVETQPRLTSGGVATTTLRSGTVVGTAIVTATADSRFGTTNVNFTAGPVDHFAFAPVGTQQAGVAFGLTITAQDAFNNTVTSYTGSNTLTDSTTTIAPTTTGNFVHGVWSGSVTILKAWTSAVITTTGSSKLGVSNPFTVTSGAPLTVTVTASPTSIPIVSGSAVVTATVRDIGGDPVADGTVVTFTTTLGAIAPLTRTTTNGVATAVLTSGSTSGTAVVVATADSRSGSTNVTFTPGPAASVALVAYPASIPIGGLTSTLTATVRDQYANLVTDGTVVTFATSLGDFFLSSTVTNTTSGGMATAALTSGLIMGTATVTATVDAISGTTTVTFTPGLPFTVALLAVPPRIPVGGSTTTVTATVVDRYNNRVTDGTVVTFATNLGSIAPLTCPTSSGLATATLTSGNLASTATVTATAGMAAGTTPVTFTPGLPFTVTITANPISISVGGITAILTATVVDQYNNNVANNTPVTFTTSLGSIAETQPRLTSGGAATATLTSGNMAGTATIIALADAHAGTTIVQFLPLAPFTVTVMASSASIPVGGNTAITATVTDQYGNLAANGTVVSYQTSLGVILPPTSTTTSGVATSTLNALTVAGMATVTATAGTAFGTTPVTFTAGAPFTVTLVASPTNTMAGTSAALTATVRDQFNNPVGGTVVTFTASPGNTDPLTNTSSAAGVATSTVTAQIVGPAMVTATADSRVGTAVVTFTPGLPFTVTLMAVPPSILVGGSTSTVTARVVDRYNNHVANGTVVTFATNLGAIAPLTQPTTGGVATSTLTSGNIAGTARVTATAGIAVGTLPVTFTAGAPLTVTVAAFPISTVVGTSVVITAAVQDQYANPVTDGTVVTFATSLGSLAPPTGTTTGGRVAAALTSTIAGPAIVTATVGARWGTTIVTFTPDVPFTVTVRAWPLSIPIGGYTSTVTATAQDQYGNLVSNGVLVNFSTSLGAVSPSSTGTVSGVVTTTLTSGLITGTARVYAYSGVGSGSVEVTFTVGPPHRVIVVAQPPTITVSTGTSLIGATVLDVGNNTVANGTVVTFATSLGAINPLMATTTNGVAQATLAASTVAGTAVVTATAGTVSGTTSVVFAPDLPVSMTLAVFPTSIPIGGDTSAITATVRDRHGNFVADGTGVNFATGLGTFRQSGSTTYYTTTTGGIATATLVSGLSIGIAQVSAAAGVALGLKEVTFTIGPPRYVTVTALPNSIPIVNGSSTVTAIVRDVGNNPVANGTVVTFATSLGKIGPFTATTISGLALATLESYTRTGTAIVTATVDSRLGTTSVTFTTPYPPELVVVTADPARIRADGVSTSTITATVTEIYGNPVADGVTVYFFVTAGATIAPTSAPTIGGIARATLTAGTIPTTVTVRVIAGSKMGETNVVLYPPPPYKLYLPVLYKNYGGGW